MDVDLGVGGDSVKSALDELVVESQKRNVAPCSHEAINLERGSLGRIPPNNKNIPVDFTEHLKSEKRGSVGDARIGIHFAKFDPDLVVVGVAGPCVMDEQRDRAGPVDNQIDGHASA